MSNDKKDQKDDIIASAADGHEMLDEETLDDAHGGWGRLSVNTYGLDLKQGSKNAVGGVNADTIYAGSREDHVLDVLSDNLGGPKIFRR